jgi:DNA-binding transcriptional MocR family regulator
MDLLYTTVAQHYRRAIQDGALSCGHKMPSVRLAMRAHQVSLSTVLQAYRMLEREGLLEARPRSGYFVSAPRRAMVAALAEPDSRWAFDRAQFVGIHGQVSDFVAKCELYPVRTNLAVAFGPSTAYPVAALRTATRDALRRHPDALVSPVPPQGDPGFRRVLARRALDAGIHVSPDEILVTHGCIEALNLALRAVAARGDTIAVESPTYFGLLQVLESLGMRALEIPTSPKHGISVDALEMAFRLHPDIRAVVVVPNLQNPLGSIMPDAEKDRLNALCARREVPLIEDDTYGALTDDAVPLQAVKSLDTAGNVIYCASLHKTLAPGMRLGWISAGRWHDRVRMLKYAQSRNNDRLSQLTAADVLGGSVYDRHLRRLRLLLKTQREQVADAIAAHFPEGTRLGRPPGGMLLWVELPERRSASAVFETALAAGIRIAPGIMFSNSGRFDHFMRISCGFPVDTAMVDAIRQLARIVATAPALPPADIVRLTNAKTA